MVKQDILDTPASKFTAVLQVKKSDESNVDIFKDVAGDFQHV